ncbi:MAG: DEAD/DEAH box helicase [Candidatus Viridilinea halotolerans]|uniref:DEAD/DEAH box helicase n=1 Tax=Candidatus Viridilinea halotolerans TaxID=2491704 RepID=A0A426TRG3_9CHLR|nr:MAG: DEAD/DEAH box helicase [Candidatus Viridilinea halotolerans]
MTYPLMTLEAGDCWQLVAPRAELAQGRLPLAPALLGLLTTVPVRLVAETPAGPQPLTLHADEGIIIGPALRDLAAAAAGWLRLECRATNPPTLHLLPVAPDPVRLADAPLTTEDGIPLAFDPQDATYLAQFTPRARWPDFRLSLQAAQLAIVAGFDELLSTPLLREVELFEHQLRTARTVLRRMRGRALLCDEVGLGKTVEAGMITLELVARGLARRTLILTPPSLVEQWQGELRRKFGLASIAYDDPTFREQGAAAWGQHERIVASYHTAKREPHRSAILAHEWDLVIIDEAHHLRNRATLLWQFAAELRKKYMLLLTATPVQNNLEELFNLVTLLQPGLLRTARVFQKQFVDRRDKLAPRNVAQLHDLLAEVMVRNRRSTVGMKLTRRIARTESVPLSAEEQRLYLGVSSFVRHHLRSGSSRGRGPLNRMTLLTLQRALGSAGPAAAPMLERLALDTRLAADERATLGELAATARNLTSQAKVERLFALLRTFPDKLVIFTQFRETQALLERHLRAANEEVVLFHGGLTRVQKEESISAFRGPARLLLTTDAGSEGRNLQFCHGIVNFDLPWNPMRIEQRIGRLSRIGQTRDVHVFNLVAADTLEAAILHLLDAKIAMFELVVGEVDMILGNLDDEQEFEDLVADTWAQASDEQAFQAALDHLGERLIAARGAYLRQRAHDDALFGERFAPEG